MLKEKRGGVALKETFFKSEREKKRSCFPWKRGAIGREDCKSRLLIDFYSNYNNVFL